jgi:predicted transcriptional regulator
MRNYKADTVAIRKIMADKGITTVVELSKISGVNRNTLGKVLDGTIQPSSDVMDKLVKGLDIEPQDAGLIFFKLDLRGA